MRKRALLIGINDYPLLGPLRYAEADAEGVAESLQRNYGFEESEIILMTPKKPWILRPLKAFVEFQFQCIRETVQNLDFLLVGFWGHGHLSPDRTSRYLCLPDSSETNLSQTALTFDFLNSYLKEIGAQNTCLILDCCQTISEFGRGDNQVLTEAESESISRFGDQTARDIKDHRDHLGMPYTPPTFAILNACMAGQQAYEWDERQHGIFTAHLLDGMDHKLDSVGRWSWYVSQHVSKTAITKGQRQTPFFKQSGAGDIVFTDIEEAVPPAVVPPTPSPASPPIQPTVEVEEAERIYQQLKAKEEAERYQAEAERKARERLEREKAKRRRLEQFRASGQGEKAGERRVKTISGVKYAFRWCPPGTFMMGSPEKETKRCDDESQHKVTLTRGFWLLETPVTQLMWQSVMGKNPSIFKGDNLPVENVSWYDCERFIDKLNGLINSSLHFRLPSEAEWEYACRAGTTTAFSFGEVLNGDKANCDGNNPYGTTKEGQYLRKTTAVKSYSPNAWKLYDMHGNVWEWCEDWYDEDNYKNSPSTDPTGPDSGVGLVYRGGCWDFSAEDCRSASRNGNVPQYQCGNLGFRLALSSTH